ncbi:hypothetical protein L917_16294 [Phytophthora nicotianae]|uniref:PDZ domain-containing protein n=7 Tax=Phytophthora nicotianae TaxID=4792 RepID=W2PQN6_PHYN3|nr:hypothetical protein PPTG_16541 [Phytophthora nicotianae INRA-310]ETI36934.1 hypothetical protein F443_17037 [Phytophthora nicotianae P1569]ETK77125.1 hypothetical protein L915_16567 [Phytophthora nicotianae]ETO65643.1 hypothetical protein F444_17068 [Phytophthora nicotianae P1976]ETL83815.1 hypothetical protein L917_16294 [Phytophthora nicotianae]ETN02295.1 hypothetical protein PPTG_16541 [Phytophthora nicotianae INRA-310]
MASGSQQHQIQVMLTLHDGERSFGMSLAQKSPALGPKYTVVSSVFANSPADRAGVRKGYVVRSINDKPVGGLTVAQVANHFRNVGQARITLEIVESAVSSRPSAFTAAATFGRVTTLPNRPATQTVAGTPVDQRSTTPVTGFSAVSSGRAIAAPGSALAVPRVAAPKQPVLRFGTKPAAKTLGLKPQTGVASAATAVASADAKISSGINCKSKPVEPVLRLGPKPKSVASGKAEEKVTAMTLRAEPKQVPVAREPINSRVPQSPVAVIDVSRGVESAQTTRVAQPESLPAPIPTPPKAKSTSATTTTPTPAAKKPVSVSTAEARSTAVVMSTVAQFPSSTAPNNSSYRTAANIQVSTASPASTVNVPGPARSSTSALPQVAAAPAVHPPEPAAMSALRMPPSPVIISPMTSANSTPARSPTRSSVVARSAPAPPVPEQSQATTKTGKKRGRPRRKNTAPANGTTSNKGKGKAKKTSKHHQQNDEMDSILDDDEMLECYAFSSDSDVEESPSARAKRRTANGRRRGATDRPRHSLTVDRLLGMGFTQEDAEASVKEIGDDPDACMVWIISKIEERQFNEDLNRASIQSEQSKRDEEKRVKKMEQEKISNAEKFMALFPTSYMVCPESTALSLKKLLQSTIDQVDGEAFIREVFSKLLTLEGQSIRWYKEASRSYMLELAGRLDTELGNHDIITCCACVNSPNDSCSFVQKVLEEVKALTTALFEMPTNQGGVPPVFLECDETTKFDLEDDGFEVIELDE